MSEPLPPNVLDRILAALRKLIVQECPQITYEGIWEYSVTSVNGDDTVNGTPTDSTIPLPSLNNVPVGGLALGGTSTPSIGSAFLVEFLNADGSKYVIVSAAPAVSVANVDATDIVEIGTSDTKQVLLGPGLAPVSRLSAGISLWMQGGKLNGLYTPAHPPGPDITIVDRTLNVMNGIPGIVTSGSEKVLL